MFSDVFEENDTTLLLTIEPPQTTLVSVLPAVAVDPMGNNPTVGKDIGSVIVVCPATQ